jgi:methyltransferase (TIGR00027 family)
MEGSVHAFEMDTAATQSCKRRLLAKAGIDTKHTQFVPCGFLTQDWLEQLESCGFDKALPTLFIWEGVAYYLPRTTVEDTLAKIATCGEGTRVAFDFFDSTWLVTPNHTKDN